MKIWVKMHMAEQVCKFLKKVTGSSGIIKTKEHNGIVIYFYLEIENYTFLKFLVSNSSDVEISASLQ